MVFSHRMNTLETKSMSAVSAYKSDSEQSEQEKELGMMMLTWNMSQSGCMNSPRKTVLYATDAMCMVWEAGSLGQKSSEALITALLFEL
jgi:hypothetical protein